MIQCDLEQAIMEAWNTKNDIDVLLEYIGKEVHSQDEILNTLIGISQLHQMRMNKVMHLFEALLKERKGIDHHGV